MSEEPPSAGSAGSTEPIVGSESSASSEQVTTTGSTWQRFLKMFFLVLAYLVVGLSVVGVLICLVATIGVWVGRGAVQDTTATGVARLDTGLGVAQGKLQRVNAGLSTANEADLDPALTALSATVVNVNSALQSLDNIPLVDVPSLDTDQMQALATRVQTTLATAAGAAQAAQAQTTELEAQVVGARAQVRNVGETAARWIDRAAFALTLVFLWMALAQASLCRSAWRYTRRRA
jgi:hypothetical protein